MASQSVPWRRPPDRKKLRGLLQALFPGASLGRVSRLRGGLASGVFRVRYHTATGQYGRIVLRMPTDRRLGARENGIREYTTMMRVREAGLLTPDPLLLDADGVYLGYPAMAMSDAGKPLMSPRNLQRWLEDLALAAAALHAVTPDRYNLDHLSTFTRADLKRELDAPPEALRTDPLAQSMLKVLRSRAESIEWAGPCLVHDDYWSGNTVWRHGRLSAVIDWTPAKIGDPREDISQCRIDLAMTHGAEVADRFLESYNLRASKPTRDIWFFDLYRGIDWLNSFRSWLPGYVDIGLLDLTEELMETRLRTFLTSALQQAR